jgi:hypothetical protein
MLLSVKEKPVTEVSVAGEKYKADIYCCRLI